ncbi:metal-dependent phosphohydrolase [Rhodopirellula baltica SH28]|uniref:Metal-dependent phosphohydrolase n=1 Tax=Rhodopirellula baltica SH28 TaxID=993517 RepID=K5DLG0_RHOBT|nr:HD domain-containing phosphohydrolase [Rhodopirellula baltica]EKK03258.1 metal-dependent phosphohydrolase [Rhodopirellula baltica SH28]
MTVTSTSSNTDIDPLHASVLAGVCVAERAAAEAARVGTATEDAMERVNQTLVNDIEQLSISLSDKFEEIRLIHDLTANLELESDADDICIDMLNQLSVCVPWKTAIVELCPADAECVADEPDRLIVGQPISSQELDSMIAASWRHAAKTDGIVRDITIVNQSDEPRLNNHRLMILPIHRGGTHLGRMISIRTLDQPEFTTVDIDLVRSVLMMLSMHLVNQRQYIEMQSMLEGMVRSLASALDAKDAYTCGHSSRVADLAVALSRRLGMTQQDSDSLQLAGILHDIGKIGIDDSVLKKPGALTDEEFDQIKRHPVLGYEILKGIRPFRHILPAVRHHHESWDGRGYPDGLSGDNIPRAAQILAVADSFDAMVSDRPYRRGMPLDKVRKIFREGRGKQWASDVVDALLSNEELMIRFAENYQAPPETDP